MNNNYAIFLDIDGTLFSHTTRKVPLSTVKILYQLSLTHHFDLYISSGRNNSNLSDIKEILDGVKGYNMMNGGLVIIDNEIRYQDFIDPKVLERFIKDCDKMQISYSAGTASNEYRKFYDNEITRKFSAGFPALETFIKDDSWKKETIEFWLVDSNEKITELAKLYPNLSFYMWGEFGCDVVPKNRNKGDGIKKIIDIMGYDISKVYAFGDADNDIGMFNAIENSIAMGNGNDKVKQAAKYVTASIDDDGIEKAIKKYILKEENHE